MALHKQYCMISLLSFELSVACVIILYLIYGLLSGILLSVLCMQLQLCTSMWGQEKSILTSWEWMVGEKGCESGRG